MEFILPIIIAVIMLAAILISMGYVQASTNEAIIITGPHKDPKILIGKAGFRIPFVEKKQKVSLELIPIEISTSSPVATGDYINIDVDAVANVKISDDLTKLKLAAQTLLDKNMVDIENIAGQVLEGNIREIVAKMKLEEMVSDREKFKDLVQKSATPDLGNMGLDIISFNVRNFIEKDGLIDNLGADNIATIQKSASIARAVSEKEVAIAQAKAQKEAKDAEVAAQLAIAEKKNALAIREFELKQEADIKRAQADAAYEIQKELERKSIEVSTVEANIAQQERTIELRQREAEVMEQMLDAQIKKKAEAERYAKEQAAEAELFERQKMAEAERFEKEQEAKAVLAMGEAEAEAIRLKGEAEAAALDKKAEAMKKYGQAAMVEMVIGALPEMAKAVAEPLNSIDKVTIIDGGSGESGVGSMTSYVPVALQKTIEAVEATTGFNLLDVMKANTYDAKINNNVSVSGMEEVGKTIINQEFPQETEY